MSIGERLKQWRAQKNIGQEDAAAIFGTSYSVYQKYEGNKSTPGGDAIKGFIKAGLNANWVLCGIGPMFLADLDHSALGTVPGEQRYLLESLDEFALGQAIEMIEEILDKAGKVMDPITKAKSIKLAYEILTEEDEEDDAKSHEATQKILHKILKKSLA